MTSARVLGVDDWPTWRDLRLRALQESPEAFGSTYAREREYTPDEWREHLGEPDEVSVVAETANGPVGLAAAYPDRPGLLHVVAMWVDPAARGQGTAHLLLDAIDTWGRDRGLGLHLDVATGNEVARRSYERYGFVGTGETRPIRDGSADRVERMVLG
jgi:ribosomal protein S18 acetylase RimI-like enzyme